MTFEEKTNLITGEIRLMLDKAEAMFGKTASNQTYIGFQFVERGPIMINYDDKVSIGLKKGILEDDNIDWMKVWFDLSHEVCHLLFANGDLYTNSLEEGIATYFAVVYFDKLYPNSNNALNYLQGIPNYYKAYNLVKRIMDNNPNSIYTVRERFPLIKGISDHDLKSLNFNLNDEEIEYLVSTFEYER